jgi:hypothetical protein
LLKKKLLLKELLRFAQLRLPQKKLLLIVPLPLLSVLLQKKPRLLQPRQLLRQCGRSQFSTHACLIDSFKLLGPNKKAPLQAPFFVFSWVTGGSLQSLWLMSMANR